MPHKKKIILASFDLILAGIIVSLTLIDGYLYWHWFVSLSIFVLFHILLHVIISPRIRMLAKLSMRDTRKRKTSSALLFCGLMLASAVVSSALIVGDSFDATLEDRLVASLGETDWLVGGTDPLTSNPLLMNQTRVMAALDNLLEHEEIDGIGVELHQRVTGITSDGSKVNPNVVWFSPDVNLRTSGPWAEPQGEPPISWSQLGVGSDDEMERAIVNQALANSLGLENGDLFSVSWSEVVDNKTIRKSHNFSIQSVVSSIGLGWENANQPLIITTLERAQLIQNKNGLVSRAVISGIGDVFQGYLVPDIKIKIENSFSEEMTASDAGFKWTGMNPGELATLTRSSGGGLLSTGDISGINSALQIVGHDSDASSFLLTPISGIWDGDTELTSIEGERIIAVGLDTNNQIIVTDASVHISSNLLESTHFSFPNIIDAELSNSIAYILTEDEIIVVEISSRTYDTIPLNDLEFSDIAITDSTIWGVLSGSNSIFSLTIGEEVSDDEFSEIVFDIPSEIIGSKVYTDGTSIAVHFETIFDSHICWVLGPVLSCHSAENSQMVFLHNNQTFIHSGNAIKRWNGSAFENAHFLNSSVLGGNSNGLIVDGNDYLLVWSNQSSDFIETYHLPSTINGQIFDVDNGAVLASTNYGTVMIDQSQKMSIQLFNSFDVGFGIELPPFFISLEGETVSDLIGVNGTVRFREGIAEFNQIEIISLGRNMDSESRLDIEVDTSAVFLDDFLEINSDLELLNSAIIGTMPMEKTADFLGDNPKRSMVIVQMPHDESDFVIVRDALLDWADRRANIQSSSSSLVPIKEEAIVSIDGAGESFSALFLIFGIFIVMAGLLLIVNLWIMSADDRSNQWGLLRAIGASSKDVEWLLRIEGVILSTPACMAGSLVGMILAGFLMSGLGIFFQATFGVGFSFHWTHQSILIGACIGFLVSVIALRVSSFFLSRRNLITSLRGLPNPNTSYNSWIILASIFIAVVAFISSTMSFFIGDFSLGLGHSLWVSGASLFLLSMLVPVSVIFSKILPRRTRFIGVQFSNNDASRNWSCTIIGLSLVIFALIEDPIRARYAVTDSSLFVSGIFILLGGILVFSTTGPVVIRQFLSLIGRSKPSFSAIASLSIAFPQSRPVRSAISMGMYSIVIFALIALSGYSTLFGNYVSDIGEDAAGEYDILISGTGQELDISPLLAWSEEDFRRNGIESLAIMDIGLCIISGNELNSTYSSLRNIPLGFIQTGALPLSEWDKSLGNTSLEVWEAVFNDPNLAIVDASIGLETYSVLGALPLEGGGLASGSILEIRDPSRPLFQSNLRVAGVLSQDASLLLSGVFVSNMTFSSMIKSSTNMVWIDVSDDVNMVDVASSLQLEFGSDGANVLLIDELFEQISLILVSLLGLLRVFLALGLFIGVTGLAVVTARSINERRQQIGVMRAIGMQRNEVVTSIFLEVGWISSLGIINGLIAGIIFYRFLFNTYIQEYGTEFVIPWLEFVLIIVFSIFMTLVVVLMPVKKGASVPPSEAMRSL